MRAVIDRLGSDLTVNKRERPDAFLRFRQLDSLGRCDPRRSPRSIWSCRTRSWIAAVVTPSSTTAVMIYLPARESATALLQNSTGKGRGMGEASEQKPDPQAVAGNQTMGQVVILTLFWVTKPWGTSVDCTDSSLESYPATRGGGIPKQAQGGPFLFA